MQQLNPLVIFRNSIVAGSGRSRSIEERLCEPFRVMKEQLPNFNFKFVSENDFSTSSLRGATHIIFNRAYSDRSLEIAKISKNSGVPLISDLDDIPIFFPVGDLAYLQDSAKENFTSILQLSDKIICSTDEIKNWVTSKELNRRVDVIQTGMDFQQIDSNSTGTFFHSKTLLFTNAGSLKLGKFADEWLAAIEEALLKNNWKLGVFADSTDYLSPSIPVENFGSVQWFKHKTMINESFPLAVVPLAGREDEVHFAYAKYKTPTKFIQYGGLGIPGVYSDSPIYTNEIENFKNGVITKNSANDWFQSLDLLMNDPELLREISLNAKEMVREKYDIKKTVLSWKEQLESTI